jgi:rSAM/selenodomain-associated transferase 1
MNRVATPPEIRAIRTIIVFARAPRAGEVKTRLAAGVGEPAALAIYRWLGARTLSAARALRNVRVVVHFTPSDGAADLRAWLGDTTLHPQCTGDLGARMHHAVADALAGGAGEVLVVGTDCPGLDARLLDRAFGALRDADVVIGPATDGGYYLIGLRALAPALFAAIPWSSADTLAHTLRAAQSAGMSVALMEEHDDIDTASDWFRWLDALDADGTVDAETARVIRERRLDPRH